MRFGFPWLGLVGLLVTLAQVVLAVYIVILIGRIARATEGIQVQLKAIDATLRGRADSQGE